MSTYLWDPFSALERLDREFNEIIRRSWGSRGATIRPVRPARSTVVPSADVVTEGNDVVINLELPGIDVEKDVTVELDRGALVVRGERSAEHETRHGGRVHRERWHGEFRREFALPETVDASSITATYDRGVLSIRLPGAAAEPQATKIPVTAGPRASELPAGSADSGERPAETDASAS